MMHDLLAYVPVHERMPMIKKFPVKVMNAGYRQVCSQIEQATALPCPSPLVAYGTQLELSNKRFVERVLPGLQSGYSV